ncbi:MAG: hypothetical protein IPK32_00100 [Verrucomicrobiaceae bacterium]|nr:hypothetical protein [Verrucomicrobiaceae bacterium]
MADGCAESRGAIDSGAADARLHPRISVTALHDAGADAGVCRACQAASSSRGARWLLCFADAVLEGGFDITY